MKDDDSLMTRIKKEIKEYENQLKEFTITIERKDQEFDGFFMSSKEIKLSNTIGDSLKIPAKSPIIVEVKNFLNYAKIIDNIK